MTMKKKDAETIVADLKKLHHRWINFRNFLQRAFTNEPISPELEQKFLEVKSHTTKNLRVLADRIDRSQFHYDPEKITNLLRQAISITHLRGLPLADKKNLVVLWHEAFIHLSQTLGAFLFISEGYVPRKRERKDTSVAGLKRAASEQGGKKKKGGKPVVAVVLVLIIIGAIYFLLKK